MILKIKHWLQKQHFERSTRILLEKDQFYGPGETCWIASSPLEWGWERVLFFDMSWALQWCKNNNVEASQLRSVQRLTHDTQTTK